MLQEIPRAPRRASINDLHDKLAALGQPVSRRSIERDLQKLSTLFSLECDGHKPSGWYFSQAAPPVDLPGMDPHAAITYRLVEDHLAHQLPRSTLRALEPWFKRARAVLSGLKAEGLPAWSGRVRAIPRNQQLLAPKVAGPVLDAVYDALLRGMCLEVSYERASDGHVSQGLVHPLGVIYRDSKGSLIARWEGHDDVRQHSLHRIHKAKVVEKKRVAPTGFSLDRYIEEGNASFVLGKGPVKLVLRVHPSAASTLLDTPLSEGQTTKKDKDGWLRVKVTVPADTRVLRSFLLGFGSTLEVVAPKRLRAELRAEVKKMSALYSKA
jgi:predicted DNA-binding transcriptional regulator YafY